jgi:hypothetical protein
MLKNNKIFLLRKTSNLLFLIIFCLFIKLDKILSLLLSHKLSFALQYEVA